MLLAVELLSEGLAMPALKCLAGCRIYMVEANRGCLPALGPGSYGHSTEMWAVVGAPGSMGRELTVMIPRA